MVLPASLEHYVADLNDVAFIESSEIDALCDQVISDYQRVDVNDLKHFKSDGGDLTSGNVPAAVIRFLVVITGESSSHDNVDLLSLDVPVRLRRLHKVCNARSAPSDRVELRNEIVYLLVVNGGFVSG